MIHSVHDDCLKSSTKIYTAAQAKTILAGALKKLFTGDVPGNGGGVVRLEVAIGRQDLLQWLSAQQNRTKFYFSGRDPADMAAAGIGIADAIGSREKFNYPETFGHMRRYLSAPDKNSNLRYYGGFAFAPDHIDADWEPFGACRFFIPRFELFSKNGQTCLACNVVSENEEPGNPADILAELEQLRFDNYPEFLPPGAFSARRDFPDYRQWQRNVNRVIAEIRAGQYKKTVLARKTVLDFGADVDPAALLFFLKKNLPAMRYDFLFQFEEKKAFVGSSPERLYKRNGRAIESEAVAGTRSRGKGIQDDDKLARELMDSDKERREHDFVIDTIEEVLKPLCSFLDVEHRKGLLKLKEGQHLISHVKGILNEEVTDGMLIDALHPTPAVGGCPLDRALEAIRRCEPCKRGWYAGVAGSVAYDAGDFAVGLRSALVDKNRLCLYSGVGIVDGSSPDAEWQEVEGKIANFLEIINSKQ